MKSLFLIIGLSWSFSGVAKEILAASHGDSMSVSYRHVDSGKRILVVLNKSRQEIQTVNLNLKKDEFLSDEYSFHCFAAGERDYAYAVISKLQAKKDVVLHPVRAWLVDQKRGRLEAVKDPKTVDCSWQREGDGEFPFEK